MGRSRRTMPLFELMRELPGASGGRRPAGPVGPASGAGSEKGQRAVVGRVGREEESVEGGVAGAVKPAVEVGGEEGVAGEASGGAGEHVYMGTSATRPRAVRTLDGEEYEGMGRVGGRGMMMGSDARGKVVKLSMAGVLLVVAGWVASVAMTWGVAYQSGRGSAKRDLLEHEVSQGPPREDGTRITDPLGVEGGGSDAARGGARDGAKTGPDGAGKTRSGEPKAPVGSGAAVAGKDPRMAGYNYLIAAKFGRREDAEAAVRVLAAGGVEAAVVVEEGVDPASSAAKNRLPWEVLVLPGAPPGQFRATEAQRAALKERVLRVGAGWKAQGRGQALSDFGDAYWKKYRGS